MTDDLGSSIAHITWSIPEDESAGHYRLCHYGTRKIPYKETEHLVISTLSSWGLNGGSYAVGLFAKVVSYIHYQSSWHFPEYKDFQGCSTTFQVGNDTVEGVSLTKRFWAILSIQH